MCSEKVPKTSETNSLLGRIHWPMLATASHCRISDWHCAEPYPAWQTRLSGYSPIALCGTLIPRATF
jgi:hypothetical protein